MHTQSTSRTWLVVLSLLSVGGGLVLSRSLGMEWRSILFVVGAGVVGAGLVWAAVRRYLAARSAALRLFHRGAVVWISAMAPVAALIAIVGGESNIPAAAAGRAFTSAVVWLVATYLFTSGVLRAAVRRSRERPIAVRRPRHEPGAQHAFPRHA